MADEIWKDVVGFEGIYKVSSMGRVMACSTGRIKTPTVRKTGYVVVSLICRPKNLKKQYKLHRLVAEHFIPNPDNLPSINHKDENKQNNRADNLEWCTAKYNSNYGHCREKISKALMGNTNGTITTQAQRELRREITKRLWENPEYRQKVKDGISKTWSNKRHETTNKLF